MFVQTVLSREGRTDRSKAVVQSTECVQEGEELGEDMSFDDDDAEIEKKRERERERENVSNGI
jgi:hypothetical protein